VTFGRFPVVPIDDRVVVAAVDLHQRFTISYWDAAIIEAARSAGCGVILSEDLSDTVDYAGVRVENPFA
jgi:predicted nucleic acid-binding protein